MISRPVMAKAGVVFRRGNLPAGAMRCRRKFLQFFPSGFRDEQYVEWERSYKWKAHEDWNESLSEEVFAALLRDRAFAEIALRAVRIESRTNFLFSFEKMALRDAVKSADGAHLFAHGLFEFLHGLGAPKEKFKRWCEVVAFLPRKQTRVLTWPIVTVFGFIAQPQQHIFLKPNVIRRAAEEYEYVFEYASRPNWETYSALLSFAGIVRRDLASLRPCDFIDIQSFLWVQGSCEYAD